jgi:hypothetical protein
MSFILYNKRQYYILTQFHLIFRQLFWIAWSQVRLFLGNRLGGNWLFPSKENIYLTFISTFCTFLDILNWRIWFQLRNKGGDEFGPINPGKNFRKCIFPDPGNFVVLIFQRPLYSRFRVKNCTFFNIFVQFPVLLFNKSISLNPDEMLT